MTEALEIIVDSLNDLGCPENLCTDSAIEKCLQEGARCKEYTEVVAWLSSELQGLCNLEEHVNSINKPEEVANFLLELSSFLKEMSCPHSSLMEGPVNNRLSSREDRILVLDFLSSELQAARMLCLNKPTVITTKREVKTQKSTPITDLEVMLKSLGFPKPPTNITPMQLFSKVDAKVKTLLKALPDQMISRPLFTGLLSHKQWENVDALHKDLQSEYKLRRELLLKRLEVTVQSFGWSEKTRAHETKMLNAVQHMRKLGDPDIVLGDLLASRKDLAILEKVSTRSVLKNTARKFDNFTIGKVPDRGGRPREQQPPPPEMPSWQQQKPDSGHQGGRGGGGRGDGGGRVQGGWSTNYQNPPGGVGGGGWSGGRGGAFQDHRGGGFSDNRGGFHNNRGGYQDNRGGYQDNRGGYQDNRGGYQDNRGGYQDNRGGYQDNRGGYQDSRGGYKNNRGGYQDNRGGYQNNRGGYQDNRGGYQNNRGGYRQDGRGWDNHYSGDVRVGRGFNRGARS